MNRLLTTIGLVLTFSYLILVLWSTNLRLEEVRGLRLNEMGDFLSGVFGPLAILWLILGFLQQGKELKQNNEALNLQASELRASVQQQTAMAEMQKINTRNNERLLDPLLKLRSLDSVFIQGELHHQFELANLGEYCEKIVVVISGDARAEYRYESLFNNETLGIYLAAVDCDYDNFNFCVSYVNKAFVSGIQSFKYESYASEDGPDSRVIKLAFMS